jgi:hypothetical protein
MALSHPVDIAGGVVIAESFGAAHPSLSQSTPSLLVLPARAALRHGFAFGSKPLKPLGYLQGNLPLVFLVCLRQLSGGEKVPEDSLCVESKLSA